MAVNQALCNEESTMMFKSVPETEDENAQARTAERERDHL